MSAVEDRLAEIEARDLTVCGSCDAGLPMSCTCGDPRASLALTVAAMRAVLALHHEYRVWNGGEDITSVDRRSTCADCFDVLPCQTRKRIAAALGVTP